MSADLYKLAAEDWPKFPSSAFRNSGNQTLNAKFRQIARIVADDLKGLPENERADWLTTEYPGGFDAGKTMLIHALYDEVVAPSRTLQEICKSMFGVSRKAGEKKARKEDEG